MPDIVSPTNLPATVDPPTPDTASDELSPPPDSPRSSRDPSGDGVVASAPTQRVKLDATPHTNGHGPPAVNGDDGDSTAHDEDQRPSKRRRTRDSTPLSAARKLKLESPPWKKIEAEGPTSFTENGRRKSGRINALVVEPQPPSRKRPLRHSMNGSVAKTPIKTGLPACANGVKSANDRDRPQSARKAVSTPKSTVKKSVPPSRSSSRSVRRQTLSPRPQSMRYSTRPRRAARPADGPGARYQTAPSHELRQAQHQDDNQLPRIRLRLGQPGVIPLVHPDQVRKRPKIGTSFADFWERAGQVPVEDGGLLASEDGPPYTDEMAQRDARWILRVEKEVEPGGLLSRDRCSLFAPEAEEEPARQWARQDHMVRAMANFRKLLLAEQQRHRVTAKKLAEACRDEWLRRQPKSADEIEAEEREKWIVRYRLVVRAMSGTWENVRVQVNRQRLEQWEAEEQKRVKAALNEAVNLSEQKLQARRGGLDSEVPSDDDGLDDLSDDISGIGSDGAELGLISGESDNDEGVEDSDNMSSSDDDDDDDEEEGGLRDAADENLTQEQLLSKYADLPNLDQDADDVEDDDLSSPAIAAEKPDAESADDASDESVDMDDDLGSSDSDIENTIDNDSDASDGDGSEEEAGGLLGLLFGKSELQQMKAEATTGADQLPESDTVMIDADCLDTIQGLASDASGPLGDGYEDDDDRMSLVRHPDSIDGEAAETEHGPAIDVSEDQALEPPRSISACESQEQTKSTEKVAADGVMLGVEPVDAPSATSDNLAEIHAKAEAQRPSAGQAANQLPVVNNAKPTARPVTEPVTVPASRGRSQSPSTSETKPLDLDLCSMADRAVATGETSLSPSAPAHARHKTEIPFLLRGTLREYQHDGLDWLAGLYANSTNGILADEMGLGKTIQTIALLAHLACHHEVWGPHLVVVPTSVMLNWEMEFKKWCPGFKILAYYGSQEERKRKRQGWNNDDVWNVCVTSYQLVLQDQQVFKRRRWHYMILDEAHNIKNFKSQRWQTLLGFNTHSRLLLTGTPLQNNLTELWSLLFFLMPAENGVGGFADLQEFHDWFHKPESQILESGRDQMDDEARAIITKLHKVLRPYLLRRLKADVEKQMPAKYEHVEFCRLSKRQRELYDGFLARGDTKATLASGNYLSIINCLMQLRKVCNHPDLFVDRPITTSFRMKKSVAAGFEFTERSVRRWLHPKSMGAVSLSFLNLIPTEHERISSTQAERVAQLSSHRVLTDMREAQRIRAQAACTHLDPSTVESSIAYLESAARWDRFEELQHCVYLNALRRQQRPMYGKNVVDLVTVDAHKHPCRPRPRVPHKIMAWFENDSTFVRGMIPTLDERADSFKTRIEKFSCVTPAVVTRDLEQFMLGRRGVEAFADEDLKLSAPVRWAPFLPKEAPPDPWHEARMRLSIQFPDRRLLQYDCGKLQVLDKLLRRLQAGGHRVLIFTQMTKVLDILEQFLNIHGHKYLRLDGATKVEQRQIMTDRFNNDSRILCFILSTRSGGLGINLTGADTVIFYDQDWNPAMDKQCQDRCHRIGQTRDVHIYRLVSEHTIEANILRKASQKQMLDDVVIQEGEFTTDYFNRLSVREVLEEKVDLTSEGVSAADAALDRVLGGPDSSGNNERRNVGRALEQAEDREDVAAARLAEREIEADDADFTEKPSGPASGASTTRQGTPSVKSMMEGNLLDGVDPVERDDDAEVNAWGNRIGNIDQHMLGVMAEQLKGTKLELPKDKKKKGKKKGKDTRKR